MKKHYFTNYYDIEKWHITDEKEFHMYDDNETPVIAYRVIIGSITYFSATSILETRPIVRWISRGEYETLRRNSGVVIF